MFDMFDIYSSTEIVLLSLDTLVVFAGFVCAVTGCVACKNKARYYYDGSDEIDELLYKYIEEGGDLPNDMAEPLLSGEDVNDGGNHSSGATRSYEKVETWEEGEETDLGADLKCTIKSQYSSGDTSDMNSDFPPSNSDFPDFYATTGEISKTNKNKNSRFQPKPSPSPTRINRAEQQMQAAQEHQSSATLSSDTEDSDDGGEE